MKLNIDKLKKTNGLALFLGMFVGDGGLSIKKNGEGYRIYPITFYNSEKKLVLLFHKLFYKLFKIKGNIRSRKRENKKELWEFEKYSVKMYNIINKDFEIPCGKKASKVRIPSFVLSGAESIKLHFFLGLLVTDGSIQINRIQFHSASDDLLIDLKKVIHELWGFNKKVKTYIQKNKYYSYQLSLKKSESSKILTKMPASHNPVLRRFLSHKTLTKKRKP